MNETKTLLITGGTGTFGNAVLQRSMAEEYSEIRIFSRDEEKQEDMRIRYRDSRIKYYIGDVPTIASPRQRAASISYSMPPPSSRFPPASSIPWRRCKPTPWAPRTS
jgi:UDP-N-acetylglucosamine 4,6-dehydratase